MITFVTFHVDYPDESRNLLEKSATHKKDYIYSYLDYIHSNFNHNDMIDLMFRSVSFFHRDCKRVLITDNRSKFPVFGNIDEIIRYSIDPATIMLSRLYTQIQYLKGNDFSSPFVFLDSDILVNENLDSLFEKDFDIAVTIRKHMHNMPFNGGVLFISNRRKNKVLRFFDSLYLIFKEKYASHGIWWGDQMALVDLIGNGDLRGGNIIEIDGIKVLLLESKKYNYTPKKYISILFKNKHKTMFHFKGKRKVMMQLYWDLYFTEDKNAFFSIRERIIKRLVLCKFVANDIIKKLRPK